MNITEILVQPQAIAWLPWAVQYFFYIGSAYAAAILFLLSYLFRAHTSHYLRSALVLTMSIGAVVGPLALTGDLHQPGRAWHFYTNITPWSWMSLGSLFLPLFSALAILTAWLYLRDDIAKLKHSDSAIAQKVAWFSFGNWKTTSSQIIAVTVVTCLAGLTIALYTGAEIYVVQSRPLWHQPAAPLLWFVTAFIGAIGFALLLLALFPIPAKANVFTQSDQGLIKRALLVSAILAAVLLPIWASNNPSFSLYESQAWLVRLGGLAVSFLACMGIALLASKIALYNRAQLLLMSAISLICCWYLRWVTIMDVQTIAKFDQGPYPYELPMGSAGLLGILGMAGLWLALALAASEIVAIPAKPTKNNSITKPLAKQHTVRT
ncbi:MAG: polysulfide reductase NrfD [Moritella sp.]|uniref:NrfD/PsrC family molybdoenzyme membrane anchor subunit n=1 Tax=Moritella sp. TaxID=78556 RepID=UPI000C0D749E|nr:NrfD/PsrC family molybdoenzyme membrane anchor subunit [Moritella sp.]MBL1416934.1 polysulfide reductase NrfD [Moritella sp.]